MQRLRILAGGACFIAAASLAASSSAADNAGAEAFPFCQNPAKAFAAAGGVHPFRPLLTFEPSERAGKKEDTAGTLGADLTMKIEPFPVMIGNYAVTGVPVSHLDPQEGTTVYFTGEDNKKCQVKPEDLKTREFITAWDYSGAHFRLMHNDMLAVDLRSELDYTAAGAVQPEKAPFGGNPCQATNLHTHGLLVSPYKNAKDGTLGDYIFDVALPDANVTSDACAAEPAPAAAAAETEGGKKTADKPKAPHVHLHGAAGQVLHHRITIPAAPSKADRSDALASGKHPSGLFWFHPHPHGYSASQLTGGTSGLITVGHLDYAQLPAGFPVPRHQNLRLMLIRDAQITPDGKDGYSFNPSPNPGLCKSTPDETKPYTFWEDGTCASTDSQTPSRWVFTVNGVQSPRFERDVEPGDAEIWRIANGSPTVSYHLSVIPKSQVNANRADLARKEFVVLAKDGTAMPASGIEKEILLMPGARVEIMLTGLGDTEYALVTEGLMTGAGADHWPRVVLATLKTKTMVTAVSKSAQAPEAPGPKMTLDQKLKALADQLHGPRLDRRLGSGLMRFLKPAQSMKPCDALWGRERVIFFAKNPNTGATKDLFGLITGIRNPGKPDPAQMTFFARKDTSTELANMTQADFKTVDAEARKKGGFVPAFGNFPEYGNVCVKFDPESEHPEIWVLENWSNEIHNFHMHQTRFVPLERRADDTAYYNFPCQSSAYPAEGPCRTPADPVEGWGDELIANFFAGHSSMGAEHQVSNLANAAHDSVPVPRGTKDCDGSIGNPKCTPGRVSIRLDFNRREHVGKFVFHCHILEHEDRGMMSIIEVHDPKAKLR
jgi:FtsP/CotA-like multicopper oxidase with cupredoxin domain